MFNAQNTLLNVLDRNPRDTVIPSSLFDCTSALMPSYGVYKASSSSIAGELTIDPLNLTHEETDQGNDILRSPFSDEVKFNLNYNRFDTDLPMVDYNTGEVLARGASASSFSQIYGYGLVDAASAVARSIGRARFTDVPNQYANLNLWGLDFVSAPEVWQAGYTGKGVTVAVIDSGVDWTHSDLNDNIWVNTKEIFGNGVDDDRNGYIDDIIGWDFVSNDNNPMDVGGHGTHVAGTIAAEKNGAGTIGVAYDAKIMPIRVLGKDGGTDAAIAEGILYAANNGADVINLSLGKNSPAPEIARAIQYATERGSIVVMAAGNEGGSEPGYPAHYATNWGIAVGSIDQYGYMAKTSNLAGKDASMRYVVAPGVDVYSTKPGNDYQTLGGTSMAAPHVSGVVALMLSANPNLTPTQVRQIITQTAIG